MLCSKKGCNLPRTVTDLPAIGDKDKDDILFGIENGVRHGVNILSVHFAERACRLHSRMSRTTLL